VTDIRGLLEDDSLINGIVPETFAQYNLDQMLQVQAPGGEHKFLVCRAGQVSDNEFYDYQGQQIVTFDHITREATGARPLDGGDDATRAAFQKEASAYVDDHYMHGTLGVYGGGSEVTICISSSKFELRNYWTGRWRSEWKVAVGSGSATITGTIDIHVHYFEDGNVQANTKVEKELSAKGGDAAALAKAVIKQISNFEQKYQQDVEAGYDSINDTSFKALRRQLPITGSKIDWPKILHMKMGGK